MNCSFALASPGIQENQENLGFWKQRGGTEDEGDNINININNYNNFWEADVVMGTWRSLHHTQGC